MSDWQSLLYCGLSGMMTMLVALGMGATAILPGIDRWSKRFFISFFAVLLLCVIVGLGDGMVAGKPGLVAWGRAVIFLEYLLISSLIPMQAFYLLHCCGEDWRRSALFRAVAGLWGVFLILLGVAQFTDCFYYISPENRFCRGEWHALLMLPMVFAMIVNLAGLIRRRGRLSRRYYRAFLINMVPLVVSEVAHMLIYVPVFVDISMVVSATAMVGIMLFDQIGQYMRQQGEIRRQHARIMVLQMRPHFIYNTMMSIYYLCEQDAKKAQRVTLDFTAYLRKNFHAIASEETIPISEELEHARAYLAVEQAQFEDHLFVDYDTPHILFRVPPLTLQPIVENAVKHGMDLDSEPLRISIRTRETEDGSEILVEDNGPGFDPAVARTPNTALANIRERLEMMCGGRLEITPRPEGGTAVRILIPGKAGRNEGGW